MMNLEGNLSADHLISNMSAFSLSHVNSNSTAESASLVLPGTHREDKRMSS